MKYTLPSLPYSYNALEPYIDEQTMQIHHTKHHQAYIDKLNVVMEKYPQYADEKLESLMKKFEDLEMTEADKILFKNHGGGHLNHAFFWSIMGPRKNIDETLSQRIIKQWSSVEVFKKEFENTAVSRFGSGWAWLVEDENKTLHLYSGANQDSPYLQGHVPLIGLDVWEHAYYLKYQNRRAEYIENWWKILKTI